MNNRSAYLRQTELSLARQGGFSLVEMLVAVGLFALIGLAGVTLVETILTTQRRTDDRLTRLSQLQRGLYLVNLDLEEASPASFTLTANALAFTRRDNEARPISIGYSMVDGVLIRTIDAVRPQPILADVTSIGWRFHFSGLGWRDNVRVGDRTFPDGIEFDIATKSQGPLRRIVDLTGAP